MLLFVWLVVTILFREYDEELVCFCGLVFTLSQTPDVGHTLTRPAVVCTIRVALSTSPIL